jgi:hypothetical protein
MGIDGLGLGAGQLIGQQMLQAFRRGTGTHETHPADYWVSFRFSAQSRHQAAACSRVH